MNIIFDKVCNVLESVLLYQVRGIDTSCSSPSILFWSNNRLCVEGWANNRRCCSRPTFRSTLLMGYIPLAEETHENGPHMQEELEDSFTGRGLESGFNQWNVFGISASFAECRVDDNHERHIPLCRFDYRHGGSGVSIKWAAVLVSCLCRRHRWCSIKLLSPGSCKVEDPMREYMDGGGSI